MRFETLRPKGGTSLDELRIVLGQGGGGAALPEALSDDLLLRLAHDFRAVERSMCSPPQDDDEQVPSMAPALFVVMELMLKHPAHTKGKGELTVSHLAMMRLLQMYQWGLEREVVSRIVGVTSGQQTQSLLDSMWRCAND